MENIVQIIPANLKAVFWEKKGKDVILNKTYVPYLALVRNREGYSEVKAGSWSGDGYFNEEATECINFLGFEAPGDEPRNWEELALEQIKEYDK